MPSDSKPPRDACLDVAGIRDENRQPPLPDAQYGTWTAALTVTGGAAGRLAREPPRTTRLHGGPPDQINARRAGKGHERTARMSESLTIRVIGSRGLGSKPSAR